MVANYGSRNGPGIRPENNGTGMGFLTVRYPIGYGIGPAGHPAEYVSKGRHALIREITMNEDDSN
jgi:hypothetical protein